MAKLRVKIKQHTPLIHFQAHQQGATLRASELKPKLDRFLIDEVLENFGVYKKILLGYKPDKTEQDYGTKISFDYKVRIITKSQKKIEEPNRLYLGNMGNPVQRTKTVYYPDEILLEFFSLNNTKIELSQCSKTILNVIAENIGRFLAVTNFGSRQSKGFGSFFIDGEDGQYISVLEQIRRQFIYIKYDHDNSKNMMNDIAIIYQLMKSGLNFPGNKERGLEASYHHSFLFDYMNNRGIGNEKKFIKEKFLQLTTKENNNEQQYVRSMLGTCEGVTFKKGYEIERKISYKNSEIERFRSPITFKIVGNYLAFIPEEIPPKIFAKEFTFSEGSHIEKICTPAGFDLPEFLFAFADYFNNKLELTKANNPFENGLKKIKGQVIVKAGDNND